MVQPNKEILILSAFQWEQVKLLLFLVIYLTLHSDPVCNDEIKSLFNFVLRPLPSLTEQG